jgi:hypothetical protein
MNLPISLGYWLFFIVPVILWLIAASFIRRKSLSAKFLSFIATSDNRLSLSRIQAFAWTMVIFGSFFAAMAIHSSIPLINNAEVERLKVEAGFKEQDKVEAQARLDLATKNASQNTPETQAELTSARQNFEKASKEAGAAQVAVKGNNWVEIPAALLALAGIAIGSGIFSTLISAVNNEQKTACVSNIAPISPVIFNTKFREATPSTSERLLLIIGTDLGSTGKVRLGRGSMTSSYVPIKVWKSDGTEVVVEMPENRKFDTLIVDTPNGKVSYEIKNPQPGSTDVISLGDTKDTYEFADLFRDDKNPNTIDLMKFQMFGWTVVAIALYSWLFLTNLNKDISSLPLVPESIVILTGLSQAGYLAGKGVSNIGSKNEG